ncbi:MAG: hypothetical protein PHU95_00700 [Candidatus Thermoplasmatota archaeon]|nr:hypothetical protein [Candidatus Thermoplasmatota archaeon]MDD5777956.1 hypothetical protein [Candidatus Thermoplasmatota archaeon]
MIFYLIIYKIIQNAFRIWHTGPNALSLGHDVHTQGEDASCHEAEAHVGMGDFFAKVRMRPPRKLPAPKPSINFSYFPGWYGSFIPLPYMMNVPRVGTMKPPTVVMEFVAL